VPCPARAIIGGDASEAAISAASILAKTTRDAIMRAHDATHPGYGFARHKGYATPEHLEALERLGPCPLHRSGFAPVRRLMEPELF
jgi:ribonuclease HII